jgi:hypothetical protein
LSNIIDSRSDLYASYNEEGDLVAKNAQGIVALNDAMAQSIKLQQEKLRQEYYTAANKVDDNGKYAVAGQIREKVLTAYQNASTNSDKIYTQSNNYGLQTGNRDTTTDVRWSGTITAYNRKRLVDAGVTEINGSDISSAELEGSDIETSKHAEYGVD